MRAQSKAQTGLKAVWVRHELQRRAGAEMVWATFGSLLSPEGWLDQEAHESDLRGSRGVALAGALMIFMGLANFRHTVHPPPRAML